MHSRYARLAIASVTTLAAFGPIAMTQAPGTAAAEPAPRIDAVITIPASGSVSVQSISIYAGSLYVAGSILGTVANQNAVGKTDVFVARLTLAGELVWARQFGSTEPEFVRDMDVGASGVFVGGDTLGSFPGFTNAAYLYHDAWVARIGHDGRVAWVDQFGEPGHDFVEGTAVGPNGELYAAGYGPADGFARRYDANGSVLWERFLEGWNGAFDRPRIGFPRAIDADAAGAIVTGHIQGSLIHRDRDRTDTWIRRYAANGEVVWTTESDPPIIGLEPHSIAIDEFGFSVIVDRLNDQWLRRYTLGGTLIGEYENYASEIEANCLGVLTAGTDGGRYREPPTAFAGVASAVEATGDEQWRQSTVADGAEEFWYTDIAGDGERAFVVRQHADYEPDPTVTTFDIIRIVGITRNGCPPFTDAGGTFRADIIWAWQHRVTSGCEPTRFCPDNVVTREQMASFLARAFDLSPAGRDYFTDDEASPHEGDINRLAASGITGGCGGTRFCPSSPVTREQMASFLARALELPWASRDYFGDDDASPHEGDINRLAASGITGGCGPSTFCPTAAVSRGQMVAFLHRATD